MSKRKLDLQKPVERVALMARVSTVMQADEGLSIAAQMSEMREEVARRGWTVAVEFIDPGVSGTTMDRPGLQAMLAAAEQRSFDILMVHELSRLSRSVFDTFEIFEHLGRYQIGFVSLKEPQFDLTTPTGRFTLTMIAAINQYYIDMLRMHTKKAKRERAREGLHNSSVAPLGYHFSDEPRRPLVILEAEAHIVREVFERYASGRYSIQEITDFLNNSGYRTRVGRRFSKDTVTDMLRNPFYVGKVVYKEGLRGNVGEVYDGEHESLISEELWDATVRVRGRHQHASRAIPPTARSYLLSQLARCHVCGRKLRAQTITAGGSYREMSYSRGYDDCPNSSLGTRADPLHQQIGAIVRQLKLPPDWIDELAEMVGEDDEIATLQNTRARLIAERRRLQDAYIHGDFDDDVDAYRQQLDRIKRALDQVPTEDEMAEIRQAADLLESLTEVWDEAEPGEQRDLMRLILREMPVDVTQDRIVTLQPTAPFIPLFRAIPLLLERELGSFVPVWPPDQASTVPIPKLDPLEILPETPPLLPFLPAWPWVPDPDSRISPALSQLLKERREAGRDGGQLVAVPHSGVPDVLLDGRKWPDFTLASDDLGEALARPRDSVAALETPLALQQHRDREQLIQGAYDVLGDGGYWHLVDILPTSMPAHWLFTYFPALWPYVRGGSYWSNHTIYNAVRKVGFQVSQREHAYYQPVSLGIALEIAKRRTGLLAGLAEEPYQVGLSRLSNEVKQRGAATLIGSEFVLVEVTAYKGEPRKIKKPRRSKARLEEMASNP
jgi:DNA invertase Pin-like site-specific DNA recombinase